VIIVEMQRALRRVVRKKAWKYNNDLATSSIEP